MLRLPRNQRFILLAVLLLLCVLPSQAAAVNGLRLRSSTKAISKAISKNVRQLVKPSFRIRSRYAAAQTTVAVSPDGRSLASGGTNGAIQFWDLATGQRQGAFQTTAAVRAVRFGTGGRYLITGHQDGKVIVWDPAAGEQVRTFSEHPGPVFSIALVGGPATTRGRGFVKTMPAASAPAPAQPGSREQFLITASSGGALALWSLESGSKVRTFVGHQGDVLALAAGRTGDILISGGADGTVRVWNWRTGMAHSLLAGFASPVRCVALSQDEKMVAAGLGDGSFHVWSLADGREVLSRKKGHQDAVLGVDFSPDRTSLVTVGKDNKIVIWPLQGGASRLECVGHQDAVNAVAFLPSGQYLVTASKDRTLRFWHKENGVEIARLIALRTGWAVVSPEGYFDGTLDGDLEDRLDAIQWATSTRSLGVDNFMENYYLPALLGRVLAGQPWRRDPDLPKVAEGFYLPPLVQIRSPVPDSRLDKRQIQVTVEATDQGGGIDEIRLYHNRKIVDDRTADKKIVHLSRGNVIEIKTYRLSLTDGENLLTARALSRDRIESEPLEIAVYYQGTEKMAPPTFHLLVVGINQYRNPDLNLNFGVPDARGVADYFAGLAGLSFKVHERRLFDSQATRQRILGELRALEKVPPQDTVLIYFAGHGDTVGDDWYFIPYELTKPRQEVYVRKNGLSSADLQASITRFKAGRILLMLDACKSGAALDAFADFAEQRPFALLSRSTGIHLVAAATKDQYANELETLGHGLFTYILLDGLKGNADIPPRDGNISVLEVLRYIRELVPRLSREYRTMTQKPVINSRGLDFSLVQK